jgi:hypothetical protein
MTVPDRDQTLRQLAQRIRLIESTHPTPAATIALAGLGPLFPGLASGMLVELMASEGAGAWSFALALAKCACGDDRLLLVADPQHCFYPPAALQLGIDLRQLAIARCDNVKDTLLAASQALRCSAVGAVIGQFERLSERDGRRLQLAAETGGGLGIFIRPAGALQAPSFAAVRLLLSPLPSGATRRRIAVQVLRCHPGFLPSPPVLRGRGAGGEGVENPTQMIDPSARDANPLTPGPSPPSTGERGECLRSALVEIDDATGDVRAFPPLDAATPAASSARPAG